MVVKGTIKNITEYGAFVDLGGIDGLLHITDMSWGRVNHPSEVFQVGDEVTVKVLKYNAETERVSLGLKQTQEDPWNHAEEAYPPGKKVRGKVMSITDYGAFVELEPGVEGLIHVSEMSWTKKVKHPSQAPRGRPGDRVPGARGRRARPSASASASSSSSPIRGRSSPTKYHPGDKIGGKVRSLTDYGVFVGIEEGVDGMVHKSDLSWTAQGQQPGRPLPQGRRRRSDHPLDQPRREEGLPRHQAALATIRGRRILNEFPPGTRRRGARSISVVDYGVFVRIRDGVEALISTSDVVEAEGDEDQARRQGQVRGLQPRHHRPSRHRDDEEHRHGGSPTIAAATAREARLRAAARWAISSRRSSATSSTRP